MGTSVNQRSAATANWAAAQAGYRSEIPVERVVQEIWRAATNQPIGDLARLLGEPIVAQVGRIAAEGGTPAQVAWAATTEIARSKQSSLAADIAQRAALQCLSSQDRVQAFGERLFVEACNYLLSRDLPGFVGGNNRNKTVSDLRSFKSSVLRTTAEIVNASGSPDLSNSQNWRGYVERVVNRLKRQERGAQLGEPQSYWKARCQRMPASCLFPERTFAGVGAPSRTRLGIDVPWKKICSSSPLQSTAAISLSNEVSAKILRGILLSVSRLQIFKHLSACTKIFERILYVLSHDNWTIEYARRSRRCLRVPSLGCKQQGRTLLFSGGLDSLAAAVDLIEQFGSAQTQLASHTTGNQVTRGAQETLLAYLNSKYQPEISRIALRTGGLKHKNFDFPSDQEREETQRTRSLMFLTIGSLTARRSGQSEVVMIAENGQMAIHLPLSAARIGAFSTHTAHPQFVQLASEFFTKSLDYQIQITNPYLYKTKAEAVRTSSLNAHRRSLIR